jgi:hypothetical protein
MSNFATIINNRTIPCTIATNSGLSFTDGKTIKVSADIKDPKKYNIACGLVLHEASHIKLSDFKLLTDLSSSFRSDVNELLRNKSIGYDEKAKIVELLWSSSNMNQVWVNTFKSIINVIEDRRIDRYMTDENRGYLEYYKALFDEYFNSPFIEKCFKSRQMTKGKTTNDLINNYMFYIINIHSELFTTKHYNDLPLLENIVKLIDVTNVNRLKNTTEVKAVALEVLLEMIKGIIKKEEELKKAQEDKKKKEENDKKKKEEEEEKGNKPDDNEGEESDSTEGNKTEEESQSTNSPEEDKEDEDNSNSNPDSTEENTEEENTEEEKSNSDNSEEDKSEETSTSNDSNTEDEEEDKSEETSTSTSTDSNTEDDEEEDLELTDKDIQEIADMLANQKKFVDHNIEKSTVSDRIANEIETYATDNVDLKKTDIPSVEVLTIINPSDSQFMDTAINPFFSRGRWNASDYTSTVSAGIQMGKVLGKKIKTRVESNELITNHIRTGRLDKRRIAAAGYGIEDVFTEKSIFTFSPATIHFTIDASGSMGGSKWSSTIKLVSAIGQAFSEISNITFKVSLRGTTNGELPIMIQFFDSSKMKYRQLFDRLAKIGPCGSTPEGICFSAIMDKLVKGSTNIDSYLVNISDGEPAFSGKGTYYSGSFAANHTNKQWEMIKKRNIKTLSYFISSGMADPNYRNSIFDMCYGKDASYIDTTSINDIAKTINTLLMKK